MYQAFNPIIQLLKPVSPLAWLPIVTMVVSATYVSDDPLFAKSFVNSLFTVALCSLWPTLINTAVGVTSVDKDLLNVSKVLRLSWWAHIRTIVLPSAIPMIFTGLRLSLGIAWMVLIAAEMLAQNHPSDTKRERARGRCGDGGIAVKMFQRTVQMLQSSQEITI